MSSQAISYIDLGVGGMTCDDCVRTVTRALESVPGVVTVDVSLSERRAEVGAESGVTSHSLTAAVRASGYNAFVRPGRAAGPPKGGA